MTWHDVLDVVVGSAQVVTAIVALYLAHRANRTSEDGHFVGSLVSELVELAAESRRVRGLYADLFVAFANQQEKRDARTRWLRERENVSARLRCLCLLAPQLASVVAEWGKVEDHEDTHALNESLGAPKPDLVSRRMATYDGINQNFLEAVYSSIAKLRNDGLGPRNASPGTEQKLLPPKK